MNNFYLTLLSDSSLSTFSKNTQCDFKVKLDHSIQIEKDNWEVGLWICGSFMFLFCLVFAMFCARLFICALWSPAGKGLTSWLSFVVSSVSLSLSHWYPGSGVVLDCIDS